MDSPIHIMKINTIKRERAILVRNTNTGVVILSYSARDLEEDSDGRRSWKEDVIITRDEFRALLFASPYRDKMVPSDVLIDWVTNDTAPDFLRIGDWFITTLLEDPITSMWCLHGKILISSISPLPGHVYVGKKFEAVLAYE
jgi:hypothetical protein